MGIETLHAQRGAIDAGLSQNLNEFDREQTRIEFDRMFDVLRQFE